MPMNLKAPLKNLLKRAVLSAALAIQNAWGYKYEAAERWSEKRRDIPGFGVQDAHIDLDNATRQELVRKSLHFERNSAIVNRMADLFEQFTVGANGLQISSASSDTDWNQNSQVWWEEWQQFCDLTSLLHFSTIQSIAARTWFVQGEVFILKTRGDTAPFRPRIQLIEPHRVATPPALWDQEGRTIIDGIEIDAKGRPIAYWVRDGFEMDAYRRIDAKNIIHIFEPSRPGQYRGYPFITPVINDIIDLEDLQALEMEKAKQNATIANKLKNVAGEVSPQAQRRERFSNTSVTSTGTAGGSADERSRYVEKVTGVKTVALKINEDLEQFRSDSPTASAQWHWEYYTWKICAGVGMSKLLVFPASIQGTVARGIYDLDNAFFRARSAVLATAFVEVRNYVLGWAKNNDRRLADPPGDWFKCNTRPPRAVNVDVGRNSNAIISELNSCLTTISDEYAKLGLDGETQIRKRVREVGRIKQIIAEESKAMNVEISLGEVVESLADTAPDPEAIATAMAEQQAA